MNKMLTGDLYADGIHVNAQGAQIFTNLFVDELLKKDFVEKKEQTSF